MMKAAIAMRNDCSLIRKFYDQTAAERRFFMPGESLMADEPKEGWLVSAKVLVSMVASAFVIVGTVLGGAGWVIGLYNGMDRRLTIVETSNARMADDIREIKAMVSQLMMNRADNRPDMQRWSK